jgi:hypothetical protein
LKAFQRSGVTHFDHYKTKQDWLVGDVNQFEIAKMALQNAISLKETNSLRDINVDLDDVTELMSTQIAEKVLDITELNNVTFLEIEKKDTHEFTYTPEEFRRHEIVKDVEGDGNCLFRAILEALNLNQEKHIDLRWAIASYMENKIADLVESGFLDEDTIKSRINKLRQSGVYGEDTDILVFEKMSQINVLLYQEQYDNDILAKIRFIKGEKNDRFIVLLHCKSCVTAPNPNHFKVIVRDINHFQSYIDKFKADYLVDPVKSDVLPKKQWPEKAEKPKGKNKEWPESFEEHKSYRQWDEFKIGINELKDFNPAGLPVYSYVRKHSEVKSFYSLETRASF